jgi:hypothetical protein
MIINYSGDEDGAQIARSTSGASESLSEAFLSIPERPHEHFPVADSGRPWDSLACWYWEFYDEIERDLARAISDDNIPPRPLRDELVYLYFKHVHPLCPIFDEFEFHAKYYLEGEELSFLQCVSLLEFQAMMFCASLVGFLSLQLMLEHENMLMLEQHLNSIQICNTKYATTHHCHTSLFETAKVCALFQLNPKRSIKANLERHTDNLPILS